MTDKRSQENELDAIQIDLYILKCLVGPHQVLHMRYNESSQSCTILSSKSLVPNFEPSNHG